MTIEVANTVLSLLRNRLNRREMQVLQAVAEATRVENGETLASIVRAVNSAGNRPISNNWVYKCLQSLQERNLLSVDPLRRPSVYRTDSVTLEKGVLGLINERLGQLGNERAKLEGELISLSSADPREMAAHLIAALSGRPQEETRGILMGTERVRTAITREIGLGAVQGSVLRFMQGLDAIVGARLDMSPFEHAVFEAIRGGATVRAILFPSEGQGRPEETLVRFMSTIGMRLTDALRSRRLQLRLLAGSQNTYRMVCIDEHTMIMFLSTAYIPDAAVLIQSRDDSGVISDAIRTFEERWSVSPDLNDPILALLTTVNAQTGEI